MEIEYISKNVTIDAIEYEELKACHQPILMSNIYKAVRDIPAADVRPVVRGKWIRCNKNAGYKCSICKARVSCADVVNGNHHYCYKCGAYMGEN